MFQEFFGINDESIFQEFMGMESNSCHGGLFLWESRKSNLESAGNKPESKPCHHLLDLFRRNFLGEERSSSSSSQTGNEKLEGTWMTQCLDTYFDNDTMPRHILRQCLDIGDDDHVPSSFSFLVWLLEELEHSSPRKFLRKRSRR